MTTQSLLSETAPAKVNLTLRVLGKRADGYHDLESLVVFARVADRLTLSPGSMLDLEVAGPTAAAAGDRSDNLVLRAAKSLAACVPDLRLGRFALTKELPVAAGIGGGSADAAAALRLLAQLNGLGDDARLMEAARATGADVPVCLDPRPRVMRGIGDVLSPPLALPALPAVMVNPGVPVPTKDVFARLGLQPGERRDDPSAIDPVKLKARDALIAYLRSQPNDLEAPAVALQPVVADVLAALARQGGCLLARMSGSGATCFGLFETDAAARSAAHALHSAHAAWWVAPTSLAG
ncbi:MAG TPA: 4-(cytidine 5'-diphospho)-2-C-methyl-D-erythritol kinase [Xanthobacteraceae bacterium]|nr:4-(cytidine 5'-diphospho)-2-C-methyl-D-erythritol kinase [Xanthobacteraceae bacterium]